MHLKGMETLKSSPVSESRVSHKRVPWSGTSQKSPAMKSQRPSERLNKPLGKSFFNLMFDIVEHTKINTRYGWMISYELPKHISTAYLLRFNNIWIHLQTWRMLFQCQAPCKTISKHTCKPNVRSKNTSHYWLNTYMYCNILYHNTLAPQACLNYLSEMAHLFFKQIYSDDISNSLHETNWQQL